MKDYLDKYGNFYISSFKRAALTPNNIAINRVSGELQKGEVLSCALQCRICDKESSNVMINRRLTSLAITCPKCKAVHVVNNPDLKF